MDATLFLVTADLIGPMMQSSKRDLQKQVICALIVVDFR
jgi:hypothetical protein